MKERLMTSVSPRTNGRSVSSLNMGVRFDYLHGFVLRRRTGCSLAGARFEAVKNVPTGRTSARALCRLRSVRHRRTALKACSGVTSAARRPTLPAPTIRSRHREPGQPRLNSEPQPRSRLRSSQCRAHGECELSRIPPRRTNITTRYSDEAITGGGDYHWDTSVEMQHQPAPTCRSAPATTAPYGNFL